MTELYEEWKKLKDNMESASARLYLEKNENTEKKYAEAVERLYQFEKENEIPLMADEAKVKKMFCPQTNEEWMKSLNTEGLVDHLYEWRKDGSSVERQMWIEKHKERVKMQIRGWLKAKHIEKE